MLMIPLKESLNEGDYPTVSFTVITAANGASQSKQHALNAEGKVETTPPKQPYEGTMEHVECPLNEIPSFFDGPNKSMVPGTLKGTKPGDVVPLTIDRFETPDGKARARTSRNFEFAEGATYLCLLDLDLKTADVFPPMPVEIDPMFALVPIFAALAKIGSGLTGVALFIRPSASAGIVFEDTGEPAKSGNGWHIFIALRGKTPGQLLDYLHLALVVAGHGHAYVNRRGTVEIRTVLDCVVGTTEHLSFEAAPQLGPGLKRIAKDSKRRGDVLDLTDVTFVWDQPAYEAECKRLRSQPGVAQCQAIRKAEYKARQEQKYRAQGATPEAARAAAERDASDADRVDFYPADCRVFKFCDGREATLEEILADPGAFHNCAMVDPLRPDDERNTAKFYWNQPDGLSPEQFVINTVRGAKCFLHAVDVEEAAEGDTDEAVPEGAEADEQGWSVDERRAYLRAMKALNKSCCLVWMSGQLNVMKMDKDSLVPSSVKDLKLWHANKLINLPTGEGKTKAYNPVDLWVQSKCRPEYQSVEFAPGQAASKGEVLNLWRGWGVEPVEGDIQPFLDLTLQVICGGDEVAAEWLLDWAADMFQNSMRLPAKAVLLRSEQGTGKNTWIDTLKLIVGDSTFIQVSSTKQLVSDFNAHLANKLLVHGAESTWGGDRSKVGPLKAMISDPDMAVEYKGKDVFSVRNFKRVILSSNEDWAIPMDTDDRRFAVFNCRKVWGDSDPFWAKYRHWRDHEGGAAKVFHFLMNRDLSNFQPWARLPWNTGGADIKIQTAGGVTKFWYQCLLDGDIPGALCFTGNWMETGDQGYSVYVPRQEFWDGYGTWARQNSPRHIGENMHWKRDLLKLCPSMKVRQPVKAGRKHCFTFPTLASCREEFATAIGGDVADLFGNAPMDEDS